MAYIFTDGCILLRRDHKEVPDKVGINKVKWSDLKSSVVHLSSSDIDSFIKVEQPTLVMFHAPGKLIYLN